MYSVWIRNLYDTIRLRLYFFITTFYIYKQKSSSQNHFINIRKYIKMNWKPFVSKKNWQGIGTELEKRNSPI